MFRKKPEKHRAEGRSYYTLRPRRARWELMLRDECRRNRRVT